MTQTAFPTTQSNVVTTMQELLSDKSLMRPDEILRRLIQSGVGVQDVINASKASGITPAQMGLFLGSAVGVLGKGEFIIDYAAKLDKEERKDFLAQTGYTKEKQFDIESAIRMGATAKLKREEAEREEKRMAEMAQALAHAASPEQRIEIMGNHFAHGGSIADLAGVLGVDKKGQEAIRKKEEQLKDEFDKKNAEKEKELYERNKRKGMDEEAARKKAREEYDAIRTQAVMANPEMVQSLRNQGVSEQKIGEMQAGAAAAVNSFSADAVSGLAQAKANAPMAKEEARKLAEKIVGGTASHEEQLTAKAATLGQMEDKERAKAILAKDKELEAKIIHDRIKDGVSALEKNAAINAQANLGISEKKLDTAKDGEITQATARKSLTAADDFGDLAFGGDAASDLAAVKGKLGQMRGAETVALAPTPKGPAAA